MRIPATEKPAQAVSELTSTNAAPHVAGPKRRLSLESVPTSMRVALVHDWFPAFRGGERVVSSLLSLFPDADIFTLFDFLSEVERNAHFGGKSFTVSPMNSWPFARRTYRHLFFLCPFSSSSSTS
jgi:hypothetical protein